MYLTRIIKTWNWYNRARKQNTQARIWYTSIRIEIFKLESDTTQLQPERRQTKPEIFNNSKKISKKIQADPETLKAEIDIYQSEPETSTT